MQSSIIARNNEVSNKDKLKKQMYEYIDKVLKLSENEGTLDYF